MTGSTKDGRAVELTNDERHHRYLGSVEGSVAAFAAYIPRGELVVFTHTETDPSFQGQGVASQLVRWALDDVRARGLRVQPQCSFVQAYIARHRDEYGDLVAGSAGMTEG
jgi:predicted GNAT family acetyltransferase